MSTGHRHRRAGQRGLVLEVLSMREGFPDRPSGPGELTVPWTFTANSCRLIEELLSRPQPDGRRIDELLGEGEALVPLTVHQLEQGRDPSRLGVRRIGITGPPLSERWQRLLATLWGAQVRQRQRIAGLSTPLVQCRRCGLLHWAAPAPRFQVLDPFTREPLRRGTGVLVVGSSRPRRLADLRRGELVELGAVCPLAGERGLSYRGRVAESLLRPGPLGEPIVLSGHEVELFLEDRPEVAREPHPCVRLGLVRSPDVGKVRFELRWARGSPGPSLRVELKFDPKVFPDAAESFGQALAAHLLCGSRPLRRLEASGKGELEIELLSPGSLAGRAP